MANTNTITDELTGKTGVQTDHGALGFGDLVVLLLDAVLLIYTAWRSYDFLTTTVPAGFQMLAIIGLWGLDIGAVAWSLVWIFGSSAQYQDWVSMAFFIIDLIGVVLTSLTDSLMYGSKGGAMTTMLTGVAVVAIPMIVVANVIAGFIYHMTSPETKARRDGRKAVVEHKRKMDEITSMERDLTYAESYLLAKQETLDKAVLLAQIKTAQDAVEKATRAQLHDQIGIQQNASALTGSGVDGNDKLSVMKARLIDLRARLGATDSDALTSNEPASQTPAASPQTSAPPWVQCNGTFHAWANATNQEPSPDTLCSCGQVAWKDRHNFNVPAPASSKLMIPDPSTPTTRTFKAKADMKVNDQQILIGDELAYTERAPGVYGISFAGGVGDFARINANQLNVLLYGEAILAGSPSLETVKGNGHGEQNPT